MVARYGDVAAWAREAGYDGVQLGSANAKLLDQFLSPFYNRRTDRYGGSFDARASLLREIREAVRGRAGADFACTVKVPVETAPPGFPRATRDEALRLAVLVEEWGFDAVTPVEVSVFPDTTLSRGAVPDSFWTNAGIAKRLRAAAPARRRRAVIEAGAWLGGRRAPFRPVWNRGLFRAVKRRVGIPVLAVGGIRSAADARSILDADEADLVGVGRPFYAEPDVARRFLGPTGGVARCRSSNRCVPAQMLGMKGVCYNPDVVKRSED
jgi:2,4-dienoyl-CoA reductase-like NADH-dependent reductase (Old Yellow Enzyme family)